MKQANTILSHIQSLPQFKLLKIHYCYKKFISLLSPRFQKAIAFVYIRNETLFVALSHPGFKMEMNYNKNLLRNILFVLSQNDSRCQNISAKQVIFFNTKNYHFTQKNSQSTTIPYYPEIAQGDFYIKSDDQDLIEAFEKIRQSITQYHSKDF